MWSKVPGVLSTQGIESRWSLQTLTELEGNITQMKVHPGVLCWMLGGHTLWYSEHSWQGSYSARNHTHVSLCKCHLD